MYSKLQLAALLSALALSACGSAPAFDYDTATNEAREAWLKPRAKTVNRGFKAGLGLGGAGMLQVQEPKINAGARRITLAARFDQPDVRLPGASQMKKKILADSCVQYLKSDFYKQNVTVTFELQRSTGSRLFAVDQTPSVCERVVGDAQAKS